MKSAPTTTAQRIETCFHALTSLFFRRWPRPRPAARLLRRCRIVAHRGACRETGCLENTLPAFDAAAAAGVWGIELDVRWTTDGVPVVFHDPDTRRLFGADAHIDGMTAVQIARRFPRIPTLADVVARYGRRQHLMIEIKAADRPDPHMQGKGLMAVVKHLAPGRDFHLMALEPGLLDRFADLPPVAMLPIARARVDSLGRLAATRQWAGLAGHFLPITQQVIDRHHREGRKIGTGFADSRRCLYREAARGVDWIFTNRAVEIQKIVMEMDSGRQ